MKLSDLPPAIREQATRAVSKELGRGNGETVQPSTNAIDAIKPNHFAASDKMVRGGQSKAIWYRTASKGISIVPVEVVKVGRDHLGEHWIDIIQKPNGAIQRTRTDGADSYHETREQAVQAVRERLDKAVIDANTERRKFLLRERLIA